MPQSSAPHAAVQAIRSLALVGQTGAGKTSLAEALLCRAGALGAPGSLERGTTVSDFDPMERRAQHSLNSAVMHLSHRGARIHLIDTPGYADFVGQSMTALEAVDTAAIDSPSKRRAISQVSQQVPTAAAAASPYAA